MTHWPLRSLYDDPTTIAINELLGYNGGILSLIFFMMDWLPDTETLTLWLEHYGSLSLWALLALGIIALPVPEETMLVITGLLMCRGCMSVPSTLAAAYAGSITGITMSYFLGRLVDVYLLNRFGGWVGLTPYRLQKAHQWFERFGKWALFIGYFIPGVRHFTGLIAGSTALDFKRFALYAYSGAVVWVSLFLALGYFAGDTLLSFAYNFEFGLDPIFVVLFFVALFFVVRRLNGNKKDQRDLKDQRNQSDQRDLRDLKDQNDQRDLKDQNDQRDSL